MASGADGSGKEVASYTSGPQEANWTKERRNKVLKRILVIAILLGLLIAGQVSFGRDVTPSASAASDTVVPTSGIKTQGFRWNRSCRWDGDQGGYCHGGIDIAGPKKLPGGPVYAMAAGKVLTAGRGSFGCEVVIDHGDQGAGIHVYSLYGHMGRGDGDATGPEEPECYESYVKVSVGQSVSAGQLIGNQGNAGYTAGSGNPAGVHLHFSVLRGTSPAYRNAIDPAVCIGSGGSYSAGSEALACLASDSGSGGGGSSSSGLTDLFLYNGDGGSGKATGAVLFANGSGGWKNGPYNRTFSANWQIYPGKFNSDSLTDLFLYNGDGGSGKATGVVLFANGSGGWKNGPYNRTFNSNWKVYPGDFGNR